LTCFASRYKIFLALGNKCPAEVLKSKFIENHSGLRSAGSIPVGAASCPGDFAIFICKVVFIASWLVAAHYFWQCVETESTQCLRAAYYFALLDLLFLTPLKEVFFTGPKLA